MDSSKQSFDPRWISVDEEPLLEIDQSQANSTCIDSAGSITQIASSSNVRQKQSGSNLLERIKRIDEIQATLEQRKQTANDSINPPTEPLRATGFFIMLFLFGQAITTWAFISAHFAAWLSGIAFSVAGLSVAMFSLLSQLDWQRQRISDLHLELTARPPAKNVARSKAVTAHFTPEKSVNEKVTA